MKRLNQLLLIGCLGFLMQSCFLFGESASAKAAREDFTESNGAIPPEFGKDKSTVFLVCIKGRNPYDKYVKARAEKHYLGEKKFVMSTRLSEYPDTKKYRFYIDYDMGTKYESRDGSSAGTGMEGHFKQFFVYDRVEDKKYKTGKEYTGWGDALEEYFKNLEKKRNSW